MSQMPQSTGIAKIGWLSPRASPDLRYLNAFLSGMTALGLQQSIHFTIELPSPTIRPDDLTARAQDLVRKQVNLIIASATPAAQAAKAETLQVNTPVVMVAVGEPMATGLVTNLARPGGNITGFTTAIPQLSAERLELLLELLRISQRNFSRVAVLLNPGNPVKSLDMSTTQKAPRAAGVSLREYHAENPGAFQGVFQTILNAPPDALIVFTDPFTIIHRRDIIAFANQNDLPAMYGIREFVEDGGLVAYGPRFDELYREAATYAVQILQDGARPADLPVKPPRVFDLVINGNTAQSLRIQPPSSLFGKNVEVI